MTTPPLDLPGERAHQSWCIGCGANLSDPTDWKARAEAAEAKVAAVREVLEHLTFVADDKYGDLAASQYYGDSELEAVAAKSIARALDGDDHHTPETETP